jgi:hopene-associated glycosyltransferase HpnB
MLVAWLSALALAAWLGVLLLPSGPWRTRERLAPAAARGAAPASCDLSRVSVVIPARNEAIAIGATLRALAEQGAGLEVIVVDDQSDDGTARAASVANEGLGRPLSLNVLAGEPLPPGWGGKLWALEQGLDRVAREYCLLLDAEIVLAPGMIAALLEKADEENRAMVSVMATLRCVSFWEKLLVPPFIFFFKLLYPFAKVNRAAHKTAAAAGGCILIRTAALREVGGFAAMRDALIDDCTLAARVKRSGHTIWLGLSESVTSSRAYPDLASFRRMVTRTAFTQLHYSTGLLVLVVILMLTLFAAPVVGLLAGGWGRLAGIGALLAMFTAYWPTLRFYRLGPAWLATLPLAALLFLAMTVESALNYWRGVRAEWKGRTYAAGR